MDKLSFFLLKHSSSFSGVVAFKLQSVLDLEGYACATINYKKNMATIDWWLTTINTRNSFLYHKTVIP